MRLARLLHSTVALIAAGHDFDRGVLNSIKSASDVILGGNRDATDAELLGLENLVDQLIQPASGGEELSVPSPAPPSGDVELPPSGGEEPGVGSSEAGGASAPSEPESVTAVAPPEASSEVPAEPLQDEGDLNLTEVHGDPLPAPEAAKEELFGGEAAHDDAEHLVDDGA